MLRWIAWPPAMTSSALVLLAEELSGAFGKHRRWRNAVDANVVATELAREAARQSDQPPPSIPCSATQTACRRSWQGRPETATTERTAERGVVDQDVDATELCRRIGHRMHG